MVILSTQDNVKLLEHLKSGFKRTIDWNKYQSKVTIQESNLNLDYLIDPSFPGVKILFVLSFENITDRTIHIGCYLLKVEIKDYHVMIQRKNFFDKPVKTSIRTFDNI